MPKPLDRRVALLEMKRNKGQVKCPVLECAIEELEQTIERARVEGSSALIVPTFPGGRAQWERSCTAYQAWLLARTADSGRDGYVGPSAPEIEAAYRRCMTA